MFSAVLVTETKMTNVNKQLNIQSMNLGSTDAENIVTLDNSMVDICGENASNHEMLPSFDAKADQVGFKDETNPCNTDGQSIGIGEHNKSLDCFLETSESKDIFCYDEVPMDSSGMLQQGDVISKSLLSFTVPCKKDCHEEVRDACYSAGIPIC